MDDLFSSMMQPFASVQTSHCQLSFYRNHLNLIVHYCMAKLSGCMNQLSFDIQEPRRIVLGEYITWKGVGPTRRSVRKQEEMMYVPILDTLQSLLRCEYIADEVRINGGYWGFKPILILLQINKQHKDPRQGHLSDYVDGRSYKNHPLFSIHRDGLQIFFYYDDLEVCNPLGSKKKIHKLSELCFYLNS